MARTGAVAGFNGRRSDVGGPLNIDPTKDAHNPSIVSIAGVPYVTWEESNGTTGQIRVGRFTDGAWDHVGGPLNIDPASNARGPSITDADGVPYVAWTEFSGTTGQIRVARLQWPVTVEQNGTGQGTVSSAPLGIDCGPNCSVPFDNGKQVTLTATPAFGSIFSGWSGDGCSGTGSCDVTASSSRTVTATFTAVSPALRMLQITPRAFAIAGRRVNGRCVALTRRNRGDRRCTRPIALRISYTLTTAASVTFTIRQRASGRRVRGRCVPPTRADRANRACTRLLALPGRFTRSGKLGGNGFIFKGRIGGRTLTPGSYQLTATPTADGHTGKTRTTSFQILR